jgi:hypothetical protein
MGNQHGIKAAAERYLPEGRPLQSLPRPPQYRLSDRMILCSCWQTGAAPIQMQSRSLRTRRNAPIANGPMLTEWRPALQR